MFSFLSRVKDLINVEPKENKHIKILIKTDLDMSGEFMQALEEKGLTAEDVMHIQEQFILHEQDYEHLSEEIDVTPVYFTTCNECDRSVASLEGFYDKVCDCEAIVEQLEIGCPNGLDFPVIKFNFCDECDEAWWTVTPMGTHLVYEDLQCHGCGKDDCADIYRIAPFQELTKAHSEGYKAVEVVPAGELEE